MEVVFEEEELDLEDADAAVVVAFRIMDHQKW